VVADEVKAAGGEPGGSALDMRYQEDDGGHQSRVRRRTVRPTSTSATTSSPTPGPSRLPDFLSVLTNQPQPLSALIAPLLRYSQSGEVNFQVEDKDAKIRELADSYKKKGQVDYLDGITIDLGNWWFNVRKSNTEPLLRLNMEAETPELLKEKMKELAALARGAVGWGIERRMFKGEWFFWKGAHHEHFKQLLTSLWSCAGRARTST